LDIFREVIMQAQKIINNEFSILDRTGLIIASTSQNKIGEIDKNVQNPKLINETCLHLGGKIYGKVTLRKRTEFYGYIVGDSPQDEKVLQLLLVNIQNLRKYYKEKFSKENFIQNLIFNRIAISDISIRAKELHIPFNKQRQLYLICLKDSRDTYIHEILRSVFPDKEKDFIITIDNKNVVFIKNIESKDDNKIKTARIILDTLNSESMADVSIYIGSDANSLPDLTQSYIDACKSKEIGIIFEGERHIIDFNTLGLGRLIYELPIDLCEMFIKEVFNDNSYNELDTETIRTIVKFFENNLNISETSRQLYIHRNTLVYRLDKIQKLTGLDLRNFDDAIIFKISMMVKRYLDKT
jgi:carbohydrate diacid regulator